MEAGAVVGADPAEHRGSHEGRAPQRGDAAQHAHRVPAGGGVHQDRHRGGRDQHQEEGDGGQVHHQAAHPLGPADIAVDVEGHRLVLGLLEGVPEEERAHLGDVEVGAGGLVGEQDLGEGGRVVLQGGGGGQVRLRAPEPLPDAQALVDEALHALRRIAEAGQAVVEGPVLTAVHGLLADEALHVPPQGRVVDLVTEGPDRADEELLAVGEHRRQHRHHVAHGRVPGHEVPGQVSGRRVLEVDAAGLDGGGHQQLLSGSPVQTRTRTDRVAVQAGRSLSRMPSPWPSVSPSIDNWKAKRSPSGATAGFEA